MATEAQINANRKNAESSTGPTSEAGKARASLNAVKTGLTARTMLLSATDAPIYQKHVDRLFAKYSPANEDEHGLVQTIADTEWRILQIAPIEAAVYSQGRDKCADLVAHIQDLTQRDAALTAEVYLMFKKDLANLALQERRLNNQLDKAVARLEALQKERRQTRNKEITRAEMSLESCKELKVEPNFAEFGFDFSAAELQAYHQRNAVFSRVSGGKRLNFDQFLTKFRAEQKAAAA